MNLVQTTKYQVNEPILKHFIKYFWVMKSDQQVSINHKLLPVNNIDFILNFSSPIKYMSAGKKEIVPEIFHLNGIRDEYHMINQTGKLNVVGISFFPDGLYPFLKTPLSEFTNKTIDLDLFFKKFTLEIEEKLNITSSIQEKIDIIENELLLLLDYKYIPSKETCQIISTYYSNIDNMSINDFCNQYGINQRKLERTFNNYIGISPKLFYRLNRFQGILNKIIKHEYFDLTSLTYENDYYDQTHFLKDFKSFTGCSPKQFINERGSVKQIL